MRYSYICIFLIYRQPYYSVIKDLKTGSIFSLENRFMASLLFIKILYKKKGKEKQTVLVLLINDKGNPEMHFLFQLKDPFKFLSLMDDLCENIDVIFI